MKLFAVALSLFIFLSLTASPVSLSVADEIARSVQQGLTGSDESPVNICAIEQDDTILAWVFELSPGGYIVVSADTTLPPVIAYSTRNSFGSPDETRNPLASLLKYDLHLRRQAVPSLPAEKLRERAAAWERVRRGEFATRFQQWPPEGFTSTGGWVETQWNQTAPYNMLCPMDTGAGSRSVAGCPAVAMAQILRYWDTTNITRFDDTDDYHHTYGGENFWVDDDAAGWDFPDFPTLNGYLDEADYHMSAAQTLTSQDKAALIFAAGVAAQQVYSAAGSGTFSVSQALAAYERFGFENLSLLTDEDPDPYAQMAANIRSAMPVHLAVVNPSWTSGHNVVVDGWNSDNYFHLNFGWGGSYDGWYLLPDEFPYDLTVLEGVIVNIQPVQLTMSWPDSLDFLTPEQAAQPAVVNVFNVHDEPLTLLEIVFDEDFGGVSWNLDCTPQTPPFELGPGDALEVSLQPLLTPAMQRDTLSTTLRLVFDHTAVIVPVRFNSGLATGANDDGPQTPALELGVYPNPFNPETTFRFAIPEAGKVTLDIFNIRGQHVQTLVDNRLEAGFHAIVWDASAFPGGVYMARMQADGKSVHSKVVLMK